MKKTTNKYMRSARIGIIGLIVIVVGCGLYQYHLTTERKKNSIRIAEYVDKELSFEEGNLTEEKNEMMEWVNSPYVTAGDKGLLYERISNIYKFQNDTLGYYQYLGYALYYLDVAGKQDTVANIYADLANYYINNDSYEKAQEMVDEIWNRCDVEQLDSLQTQSFIYRIQAVLSEHEGNYEDALRQLELSEACVDQSHTGIFEDAYYAMIDVVRADVLFMQEEYEAADAIVAQYAHHELFDSTVYRSIVVRDFIIPYYEVAAKLAAYHKKETYATQVIDAYCYYCEEYEYWKNEIDTLLYLMENYPAKEEENNYAIYDKINKAYLKATDMQSVEYTLLIDSQLQNSMEEQTKAAIDHKAYIRKIRVIIFAVVIGLLVFIILLYVMYQNYLDGLTKIGNRRALNLCIWWNKMTKKQYAVIMMDIDDFKKVNDTYGHGEGDLVLQKIGRILLEARGKDTDVFRYGGEEFAVVIRDNYIEKTISLAEHIRWVVENSEWNYDQHITISVGVAGDKQNQDVLKEADKNLYYSKCNGKNIVTYQEDGQQTLYRTK